MFSRHLKIDSSTVLPFAKLYDDPESKTGRCRILDNAEQ